MDTIELMLELPASADAAKELPSADVLPRAGDIGRVSGPTTTSSRTSSAPST